LKILFDTPVEIYEIDNIPVYVKREDLCAPEGAPPFSKIRGLYVYLEKLKEEGITTIGYTETSISMAGWGITWACKLLGLRSVIFNPVYKETPITLEIHRKHWIEDNAIIVDLKAGMAKVNWNISKNVLKKEFGAEHSILLPLGLPLQDTIIATTKEAKVLQQYRSIVVNVGSGTIFSGIYSGMGDSNHLYGIMGRTGSIIKKRKTIINKVCTTSLFYNTPIFTIIDPGYNYTDSVDISIPFPCNKFYDAKAWLWLIEHINELQPPILFWNIGANSK